MSVHSSHRYQDYYLTTVEPKGLCHLLERPWDKLYIHQRYNGRLTPDEHSRVMEVELAIQTSSKLRNLPGPFKRCVSELEEGLKRLADFGWSYYQAEVGQALHILMEKDGPTPSIGTRLSVLKELEEPGAGAQSPPHNCSSFGGMPQHMRIF